MEKEFSGIALSIGAIMMLIVAVMAVVSMGEDGVLRMVLEATIRDFVEAVQN